MNWAEFLSMGGRGFYVWGSFGAFLACVVIEIIMVRVRVNRAQAEVRDEVLMQQIQERR